MVVAEHDPAELLGGLNEAELKYVPKRLFAAGDASLLQRRPRVSIIGTRSASSEGLALASGVSKLLASQGAVIVSGLARGVDTVAHRAAMDAGGSTIAVVGTPLSQCYPKENRSLQDEIAAHHLVLSQFAEGRPVSKKNWPMRNRTMALISQATVIIEAGEQSGTEHQAWEAIRLGRTLLMPETLATAPFEWPSKVLGYGGLTFSSLEELKPFLIEFFHASSGELSELPF